VADHKTCPGCASGASPEMTSARRLRQESFRAALASRAPSMLHVPARGDIQSVVSPGIHPSPTGGRLVLLSEVWPGPLGSTLGEARLVGLPPGDIFVSLAADEDLFDQDFSKPGEWGKPGGRREDGKWINTWYVTPHPEKPKEFFEEVTPAVAVIDCTKRYYVVGHCQTVINKGSTVTFPSGGGGEKKVDSCADVPSYGAEVMCALQVARAYVKAKKCPDACKKKEIGNQWAQWGCDDYARTISLRAEVQLWFECRI
jgi:hypothetical protein